MPLFMISRRKLLPVEQTNFPSEKELQALIESNLEVVFNCRRVASEFDTGALHAGRIDTLALSEDNNPVIIEYKKIESSDLINQSLFYLSWIQDHRGDFHVAAQKALGQSVVVDWGDVRVICIAPNFRKYDLHAVQMMGANIELWQYRVFKNDNLYLEEVFKKSLAPADAGKLSAGKKAALTRATSNWTLEHHLKDKPEKIRRLVAAVREYALALDPAMEEAPKKFYIAYKISQNILCMEPRKNNIYLYLKLDPKEIKSPPANMRDVSKIGHYGTGDIELTITSEDEVESAKKWIERAYQRIGG